MTAAFANWRNRRGWGARLGALVLASLTLGCAYRGDTDEPVLRRATWFSYLDGGGIREACAPGTIDRYRLVYNARYNEQLRSYEITGDGAGGGIVVSRAIEEANLAEIRLDDLQAPWRWKRAESRFTPAEMRRFTEALAQSGLFGAPPDGLRLNSWAFYWVASGCRNGEFHFSAWTHPSARWEALTFPELLLADDETGVAVNRARKLPADERFGPRGGSEERGAEARFTLQVDGSGLGGITALR